MTYRKKGPTNSDILELERGGDKLVKEAAQDTGSSVYSRRKLKDALSHYKQALKTYDNTVTVELDLDERQKGVQSKIHSIESKLEKMGLQSVEANSAGRNRDLVYRFSSVMSIIFLVMAAFFVSFSLTGNAIGNITVKNGAWISMCLFVVGLVCAFVYARGKKK